MAENSKSSWRTPKSRKLAKVNANILEKRNTGKPVGAVPPRADYVVPQISKTGTALDLGAPAAPVGTPATNPGKIKVGTNPIGALRKLLGLGGANTAQPVDRSKVTQASVASSGSRGSRRPDLSRINKDNPARGAQLGVSLPTNSGIAGGLALPNSDVPSEKLGGTSLGGVSTDPAVQAAQEAELLRKKRAAGAVSANIPKTILG